MYIQQLLQQSPSHDMCKPDATAVAEGAKPDFQCRYTCHWIAVVRFVGKSAMMLLFGVIIFISIYI